MDKLRNINRIMAFFIILMTLMGMRDTYANAQKYGWTYTQFTIIGEEVTETIISFGSQLFAMIFFGSLGILLLGNSRSGYILDMTPLKEGEVTGINFPRGTPDTWDWSIDPHTKTIFIEMNGVEISFPITIALEHIEKYEKKNLEETK